MNINKRNVLAFDLGITSGRVMLVHYADDTIQLEEIHKFRNEPVSCHGHLYWNVLSLLQDIKTGIRKAHAGSGFDSVGIDAWGVDYGLIDKRGALLANPLHYQDIRTNSMSEKISGYISPEKLYMLTGCQIHDSNTIFQLSEHQLHAPELLKHAQAFLLMPDLFAYLLTGDISSELSIASTTQLCHSYSGVWSSEIVKKLGLPEHIFPAMAQTGTMKGMLSEEICQELHVPSVPVVAVCGHNVQCAVTATPVLEDKSFAFINCESEASLGTELKKPLITPETAKSGFSNEIGFENTTIFLKYITGTSLLQKLHHTLEKQGKDYSYTDLEKMAVSSETCQRFIDVDAPAFSAPDDILFKIRNWCIESGQPEPVDIADITRCIYESLACRFRDVLDEMQFCTRKKIQKIYMLGNGVKDSFLCQLTADACQLPVCTGSEYSAIIGNAVIQLIASGVIPDLSEARWLIAKSIRNKIYMPNPEHTCMYEQYQKFYNL